MEKIKAKTISEQEIVLRNPNDIETVIDRINDEEDFILEYKDKDNNLLSELITTEGLGQKIKDGSLKIKAFRKEREVEK
jgi:hypothetical protein